MINEKLIKIIKICLFIDQAANEIYKELSNNESDKNLKIFWENMSDEEYEHVIFWEKTLEIAKKGMLPEVFDNEDKIINELEKVKSNTKKLKSKLIEATNIKDAFLFAFRMEFYLLHPAFETLFHFMKVLEGKEVVSPEDEYDNHISAFIDALTRYGAVTPELELLGETLQRLWSENQQLALQSTLDELTKIFNRRGFFNVINPLLHFAARNKTQIGIIMFDVDHFKKVNDIYGHQKGDEILKFVADTVKRSTRGSDVFGRYGGEEFILYLSSVKPEYIKHLGENIRKVIEDESKKIIPITISVGVSYGKLKDNPEKDIMHLIKKADDCLYTAKNNGRNRVVVC